MRHSARAVRGTRGQAEARTAALARSRARSPRPAARQHTRWRDDDREHVLIAMCVDIDDVPHRLNVLLQARDAILLIRRPRFYNFERAHIPTDSLEAVSYPNRGGAPKMDAR